MAFIGIDFSGSAGKWRPNIKTPTVWIAKLTVHSIPTVQSLMPVQDLPGNGDPFDRLVGLLEGGDFVAAGIDAPFSIPAPFIPAGGWPSLVALNAALPHLGRPFPKGDDFLAALTTKPPSKPLRETERAWQQRGINVRSTMWWKPRGGAPFTTACLKLIAHSGRPCWPWNGRTPGMLVEAFPAAQLRQWSLEHQGYSDTKGSAARNRIVDAMSEKIVFGRHEATVRQSADALDAVLAAFAGIAAWHETVTPRSVDWPPEEGVIAVHP